MGKSVSSSKIGSTGAQTKNRKKEATKDIGHDICEPKSNDQKKNSKAEKRGSEVGTKVGSKKGSPWVDPSPETILNSIRTSRIQLHVQLVIKTRLLVSLLECGVSEWEELIRVQRIVASVQRPRSSNRTKDGVEEVLLHSVEGILTPDSVNNVWKFTNDLSLRLQSIGIPSRVILAEDVKIPGTASSKMAFHEVVVTSKISSHVKPIVVQRALLSSTPPPSPDFHPELRNLVSSIATRPTTHVFILRGIPGSGKSSISHQLLALCTLHDLVGIICSADMYFNTSRGYVFNVKELANAHKKCQEQYLDALRSPTRTVIIVDNTHTQRWEYEYYEKEANQHEATVSIIEMSCPDLLTSIRMAQRNSHGVRVAKVMAMYLKWERDERALCLKPCFNHDGLLKNPVTRNPFNNFCAYIGLFLTPSTRETLLNTVQPIHPQVLAEHITLCYRPKTQYIRQVGRLGTGTGTLWDIKALHAVHDNHGQAIQVSLAIKDGLSPLLPLTVEANKIPHITLSTAPDIPAVYSNKLLQEKTAVQTSVPLNKHLDVQVGMVLMAQQRKVILFQSPFEVDTSVVKTMRVTKVVMLYLDEEDLDTIPLTRVDLETRGLRYALVMATMNSGAFQTRRVLCIKSKHSCSLMKSSLSTRINHISQQLARYLAPAPGVELPTFNSVCVVDNHAELQDLVVQEGMGDRQVVLLTTDEECLESLITAGSVIVQRLPSATSDLFHSMGSALSSNSTKALDDLGVAPTERVAFLVAHAIALVQTCIPNSTRVERVDTTLVSLPSPVVDLCVVGDWIAMEEVHGALSRHNSILVANHISDGISFTLALQHGTSPVFRLYSYTDSIRQRFDAIEKLKCQIQESMPPDEESYEQYPQLLVICRSMLLGAAELITDYTTPTTLRILLTILCENIVFSFLKSHPPQPERDTSRKVCDSLWFSVQALTRELTEWSIERWQVELHVVARFILDQEHNSVVQALASRLSRNIHLLEKPSSYLDFLSSFFQVYQTASETLDVWRQPLLHL